MTLYQTIGRSDVERIHSSALKVLHEVGVRVESAELLGLLGDFGAQADFDGLRARFSPAWVEQFIADSDKYDWGTHQPHFGCYAGIYQCLYLNPDTGHLEAFGESTLVDYIRLGRALDEIGSVDLLGLPFAPEGVPAAYGPLGEKLYGWKWGASPSGTVQFTGLCPYLVETYECFAQHQGRALEDVFGAVGYLVSPLRLARGECEQLLYFRSRGLRMHIGHMLSLGASAPVTPAGAAVLKLAESLFLSILHRALWGGRGLGVGGFGVVMDMRTAHSMGGRPERAAVNALLGAVARHYGVRSGAGGGLADAKEPSAQAGVQKAMTSLAGIFTCGSSTLDAGILSLDEICSPEQMVYDAEMVGAIRHMLRPVDMSEEARAVADIAAVGPGGSFIGSELTARRFRDEMWEPRIWDRLALQDWRENDGRTERERVRDRIRELLASAPEEPRISEQCERDLRAIIDRAVAAGAAE